MSLLRKLLGLIACGFTLGLVGAAAWAGDDSSEIVAEIGGKKITRAELERKESAKLLSARYKLYLAERQVLSELIDEELLKQQAEREHVSVDELVNRHVTRTVTDPTEDQLRVYYEGMQTEQPFEEVRSQIVEGLRQLRIEKARAAYLATLRQQESAKIVLEPPEADVRADNAPVRGTRTAPVTLIEFADYQCPYCQKIHPELKQLQQEFPGKVAFIFKDFPLPAHNRAPKAAEASRCAGDQGKYWEYHDLLFQGKELDKEQLKLYAHELQLDQARFDRCLDSGQEAAPVEKDVKEGKSLGVVQTPAFFVNGHFFSGAVPYSTLRDLVQQQITASEKSTGADSRAAR